MIAGLVPGCSRSSRCDRCADDDYAHLGGAAGARGLMWADRARAAGRTLPWPSWEAARGRAEEIVANLAGGDPQLLERFARRCYDEAKRWYEMKR